MKQPKMTKKTSFLYCLSNMYRDLRGPVSHRRTLKLWAIAHENNQKWRKRRVFLYWVSKMYRDIRGLVSHRSNLKLWAIAHENSQNDKMASFLYCGHRRTLKLWEIAHENSKNDEKDEFFVLPLKHVSRFTGPCKSPKNHKTVSNSSWKQPKMTEKTSFLYCLSHMYRDLRDLL